MVQNMQERTSPMPEEAPVISTTFPATFSLKIDLTMKRRILNNKNGGKISTRIAKLRGGTRTFNIA